MKLLTIAALTDLKFVASERRHRRRLPALCEKLAQRFSTAVRFRTVDDSVVAEHEKPDNYEVHPKRRKRAM